MREYKKLNSTGSLLKHVPTNTIYSYRTPIYQEFCTRKGLLKVFNDTYYSATTRKHQAKIRDKFFNVNLILHYCPYGEWTLETGLSNEIEMVQYEIETLSNKPRKLGKRQAEKLETLTKRLQDLKELYKGV